MSRRPSASSRSPRRSPGAELPQCERRQGPDRSHGPRAAGALLAPLRKPVPAPWLVERIAPHPRRPVGRRSLSGAGSLGTRGAGRARPSVSLLARSPGPSGRRRSGTAKRSSPGLVPPPSQRPGDGTRRKIRSCERTRIRLLAPRLPLPKEKAAPAARTGTLANRYHLLARRRRRQAKSDPGAKFSVQKSLRRAHLILPLSTAFSTGRRFCQAQQGNAGQVCVRMVRRKIDLGGSAD